MFEKYKPKVFIGYDSREDLAWHVCRHSLLRHSADAVDVVPLRQDEIREEGVYTRPYDLGASTEFSLTRFLKQGLKANDEAAAVLAAHLGT